MKKLLYAGCMVILVLKSSSCSSLITPNYTTVDNLTKLNPGMSKQQALTTLENPLKYKSKKKEKKK